MPWITYQWPHMHFFFFAMRLHLHVLTHTHIRAANLRRVSTHPCAGMLDTQTREYTFKFSKAPNHISFKSHCHSYQVQTNPLTVLPGPCLISNGVSERTSEKYSEVTCTGCGFSTLGLCLSMESVQFDGHVAFMLLSFRHASTAARCLAIASEGNRKQP